VSHSNYTSIRPYRDGDERDLVSLFQTTFGRSITEDHWRWKLHHQPMSVPNVWLAISNDRPIFQYAGIPTRFWLSNSDVSMMVSVDTMTDPDFRRRGLLTEVGGRAYTEWRAQGVAFVIGLPNQQWGSRAGALGWLPLFPLQWHARPLCVEAILARRCKILILRRLTAISALWNFFCKKRLRPDAQVRIEQVMSAGADFDRIWARCRPDSKFSTVRDSSWVNWRFFAMPSQEYQVLLARRAGEPVGYLAYRLLKSDAKVTARLADMVVARNDRGAHDALIGNLIERLLAADVDVVATLMVPGTQSSKWLRAAGFFRGPAFSVQLVPLAADLPIESMRDSQHWRLTGADFDVI
jgi:hypothetical protein